MPELMVTLIASREKDHNHQKFLAAIQGIDLDSQNEETKGQKEWEDMKARVFSGGKAKDASDIVSLQGSSADKVGFGIGMGLEYDVIKDGKI